MNKKLKGIPATEIKNRFGDYLGEVVHGNHLVLIEKHGKPVAVIISYKSWKGADKVGSWIAAHADIMSRISKRGEGKRRKGAVNIIEKIREEKS